MTIKAKVQVGSVVPDQYGNEQTRFHGVYGGDTNAEDNTFSAAATPYLDLVMGISNPDAKGFFKQGKKYNILFEEAAE